MRAEIKSWHSPDIIDLELFVPKENDNFGFLLELEIGNTEKEGLDLFQTVVCTPKWFEENYAKEKVVFGLHFTFVFEYNFKLLRDKIIEYVEAIEKDNWDSLAAEISYVGEWEFKDYKE